MVLSKPSATKESRETGQSLVELAMTFTVLMLLLAVTVDLGRLFFSYISVRDAAEQGALIGSIGEYWDIENTVRDSSSTPVDLESIDVSVNCAVNGASFACASTPPAEYCAGNILSINVVYQFPLSMPMVTSILGASTYPLSSTSSSTILRPDCP